MWRMRTFLTIAAIGGGAVGAIGCGSSSDSETTADTGALTTPTANASTTSPERAATPRASSSRVTEAVRALKTAGKQVKNGRPYDLESDRFRGKSVWEVKVASGRSRPYEFYISANGKTIVRRSRERKLGDDVPKVLQAKVTLARALRTAAKHAGGGRLSEGEIDRDRGKIVWTVTFERSGDAEVEVILDAKTGRLIRTVKDDD